jgi:hypothetical protein
MIEPLDLWLALEEFGIKETDFYHSLITMNGYDSLSTEEKLDILSPFLDTWGRYPAVMRYMNDD